jgi:hypothetical protein
LKCFRVFPDQRVVVAPVDACNHYRAGVNNATVDIGRFRKNPCSSNNLRQHAARKKTWHHHEHHEHHEHINTRNLSVCAMAFASPLSTQRYRERSHVTVAVAVMMAGREGEFSFHKAKRKIIIHANAPVGIASSTL